MSGQETNFAQFLAELLTRREREILALLAQGQSAPEIAQQLTIATSSVKTHIQHIYGKLGVNSKRQAVARARELGMLQPSSGLPPFATSPLSAASDPKHNLPLQLTRFFGRERDKGEIRNLLLDGQEPRARLVTLVGPGGAGKTRLALAVAHEVLTAYSDGVWLIELASLADAELLGQTVANALGLRQDSGRLIQATLIQFLRPKHFLLVLDSCEHLVDACARLAEELLRACPRLQILATSREALGTTSEMVWPVPGLDVPPTALESSRPSEHAAQFSAVQLFIARAQAVLPAFNLTAQNAASLTGLCQRLDGLPLAIELAAARVALLPVEQIAALLDNRFRLLTSGSRTALPRHQTLFAAIDWSYRLLTAPERTLLQRLAVFAGGWTLEAAESVCAGLLPDARDHRAEPIETALPAAAVLDGLSRLAAQSLVVSEPLLGAEARFHLLETIRDFAHQKLDESKEAAGVRQRHLDYYLALAERAEPELRGRDQMAWYDRLDAERDNLRAAFEWAAQKQDTTAGLRLAAALHRFWEVRGYWSEGYQRLNQALALDAATPPSADRAMALARAVRFANLNNDRQGALTVWQECAALARELGSAGWRSAAYALMEVSGYAQSLQEKRARADQSVALFRQSDDRWGLGMALQIAGWAAMIANDSPAAAACFDESLTLFQQLGDRGGIAGTFNYMGMLARQHGDYARARQLHEKALAQFRQLRERGASAFALTHLAFVLDKLGRYVEAMAAANEAMVLFRSVGDLGSALVQLQFQNQTAVKHGDYERALAALEDLFQLTIEAGLPVRAAASRQTRLGQIDYFQGRLPEARAHFEAGLKIFRELKDENGMGWVPPWLGCVAYREGNLDQARALIGEGLAIDDPDGYWPELAFALLSLGEVTRAQGEPARAAELYARGLRLIITNGSQSDAAPYLEGFAKLAIVDGRPQRAARLFGAAEALRDELGTPVPPVERDDHDRAVALAHGQLDPAAFGLAWDEGLALSREQAVAYALEAVA